MPNLYEIHIIGAGTPTPRPERFGTSWTIAIGRDRLLFDCGPATTYKMTRMGLAATDVTHLFFTHITPTTMPTSPASS